MYALPALLMLCLILPALGGCDRAPDEGRGSAEAASEAEAKADDAPSGAAAAVKGQAEAAPAPAPAVEPPCETLTKDEVGAILGWSDLTEGQANQMNEGRLQNCGFNRTGSQGGSVRATITRGDARTIEKKYIERAFAKDLENTDERIRFAEVTPKIGDQTIFAEGTRGPHHIYQLRWRIGNQLDHLLELRSSEKMDGADAQARLRKLAAKL